MAKAELVLRYLDVLLDWPLVGLILGATFLWLFRQPFSSLIGRVIEAEGYGAKVKASPPSQERPTGAAEAVQAPTEASELDRFIASNPEKVREIIIRLGKGYRFERAFNAIYGTQIDLLEYLQTVGTEGEPYIELRRFFDSFVKLASGETMQMADYLRFLVSAQLMEYFEQDGGQRARITPLGVDFLSYIKSNYGPGYRSRAF